MKWGDDNVDYSEGSSGNHRHILSSRCSSTYRIHNGLYLWSELMEHTSQSSMGTEQMSGMSECIENCLECFRICEETVPHCLTKGGEHANASHVTMLSNCAAICQTSAKFMLSGSELHVHTCEACATVCERCANECERFA